MPHPITRSEHVADLPDSWKATMDTAPLPDGREKTGIRLHRADSVHVIAKTAGGDILLLREFRPFLGAYIWMLPSGKADKEGDLRDAALRELREEAGFGASALTPFFTCYITDTLSIRNHVFLAEDLYEAPLEQDGEELIEVHELSLEEAIERVLSSEPMHAISAAALLRLEREGR